LKPIRISKLNLDIAVRAARFRDREAIGKGALCRAHDSPRDRERGFDGYKKRRYYQRVILAEVRLCLPTYSNHPKQ
jgi:hypothetical protein